jgi:predicted nucleic acid-binding protein
VDDPLVRDAAEIKAERAIAYADAFCVALAQRHKGRILTGDPEFETIEKVVAVQWLKARN